MVHIITTGFTLDYVRKLSQMVHIITTGFTLDYVESYLGNNGDTTSAFKQSPYLLCSISFAPTIL